MRVRMRGCDPGWEGVRGGFSRKVKSVKSGPEREKKEVGREQGKEGIAGRVAVRLESPWGIEK